MTNTNTITPLFQLNLLLHLCLPYPANSGINPYFHNKGFKIRQIEKGIPLPDAGVTCLKNMNVNRQNVTPEIVLSNEDEIILFECKVSDFDVDWSHHSTTQAAGYLTLNSDHLCDFFGIDNNEAFSGKLLYGVPEENEAKVVSTLLEIKNSISNFLTDLLPHETFTITCNNNGAYISVNENSIKKSIKIIDYSIMCNENLFYLIPTDINGNLDPFGEQILKSQVKSVLRSLLGRGSSFSDFEISVNIVCKKINPIWDLLPIFFQKKFKYWIKINIKFWLDKLASKGIKVEYEQQKFIFSNITPSHRQIIRKELISAEFFSDESITSLNSIQLEFELD